MNPFMQEANSFWKINWACAVTLNPFVRLGVYLIDNYRPVYLKKAIALSIFFVWKCAWWGNAENGVDGKEIQFFLFNSIKLVWFCILMVCLYIWLSKYTNNETLSIIWKFDLSPQGVLGRIYSLCIEVLCISSPDFSIKTYGAPGWQKGTYNILQYVK